MAITRAVASSITQGLPKSKSTLSGNLPILSGSYESIATVTVGAGGQSTVSFTSIPSTYKHLQLRCSIMNTTTNNPRFTLNNDTIGANYYMHSIYNNNPNVSTYNEANNAGGIAFAYNESTTSPTASITDILDYSNTNKYKTSRIMSGYDANGTGYIFYRSGLWMSTSAVNRIDITSTGGNLAQYSSFALYGIL